MVKPIRARQPFEEDTQKLATVVPFNNGCCVKVVEVECSAASLLLVFQPNGAKWKVARTATANCQTVDC